MDFNKYENEAEKRAINAVELIERGVNTCYSEVFGKVFVDRVTCYMHRTLQQKFFSIVIALIRAWASEQGGSDLRNQRTVEVCKELCKVLDQELGENRTALPCI